MATSNLGTIEGKLKFRSLTIPQIKYRRWDIKGIDSEFPIPDYAISLPSQINCLYFTAYAWESWNHFNCI